MRSSEALTRAPTDISSPQSRPPPGTAVTPTAAGRRMPSSMSTARSIGRRNRTGRRADHVAGTATDQAGHRRRPPRHRRWRASRRRERRGGSCATDGRSQAADGRPAGPRRAHPARWDDRSARRARRAVDQGADTVDRRPDTHPEVVERVGTERLQRDQVDVGDRQTFGHAVGRVRRRAGTNRSAAALAHGRAPAHRPKGEDGHGRAPCGPDHRVRRAFRARQDRRCEANASRHRPPQRRRGGSLP